MLYGLFVSWGLTADNTDNGDTTTPSADATKTGETPGTTDECTAGALTSGYNNNSSNSNNNNHVELQNQGTRLR